MLLQPDADGGAYRRRFVDSYLDELAGELPAFMITGPRACGKTTTAAQRARSVLRLDDAGEASAFSNQPDAYLAALEPPVLIDEWQEAPESLASVKRAVDSALGAGRFFITGSVRARRAGRTWPGTGRVLPVRMWGMTRAEEVGQLGAAQLVDDIFAGNLSPRELTAATVFECIEIAARGGFPDAMAVSHRARAAWFDGYIEQLILRDTEALGEVREPGLLRDLLVAVAHNTARLISKEALARSTGANARTIERYLGILVELGVVERLPGWDERTMKGLAKAPKYHVTDTGLAMRLARLAPERVVRDGGLLGQYVESFVLSQLRPMLEQSQIQPIAHHFRDAKNDREVDVLLAAPSGEIAAIEVKAAAHVAAGDLRHLAWMRDRLGDRFSRGVVFYAGSRVRELGDRLWAVPLAALWEW